MQPVLVLLCLRLSAMFAVTDHLTCHLPRDDILRVRLPLSRRGWRWTPLGPPRVSPFPKPDRRTRAPWDKVGAPWERRWWKLSQAWTRYTQLQGFCPLLTCGLVAEACARSLYD